MDDDDDDDDERTGAGVGSEDKTMTSGISIGRWEEDDKSIEVILETVSNTTVSSCRGGVIR